MRYIRSPGLGLRSIELPQQPLALVAAPVQRRALTPAHNLPHAAMPRCSPPLPLSRALTQGQAPSGWKFPNGGNRQLTRRRRQIEQPLRHPRSCVAGAAAAGSGACATGTCSTGAVAVAATAPAASASPLMELFAVVLGYACLAGSIFRSVPQIAVILRTGSAEGLSLTSNLTELLCFTVTVAYNIQQGYSFNTYGEVFSCWIQDAIIVGLILRHMHLSWSAIAASTAAFTAICAWLFSPMCPMDVLSALQMSNIVVMAVGARLPQIWLNVKRGNAGVLSPLTCLLNVAGCVVRVFTTAVLTRDGIIMGGCISQLVLNAILLYQSIATPGQLPAGSTATAAAAATAVAATDPPSGGTGSTGGQLGSGSQGPAASTAASGNNAAGGNGGHAGVAAAAAALSPGQKGSKLGVAGATGGNGGGDDGSGSGSGGGDDGGVTPLPLPAAA